MGYIDLTDIDSILDQLQPDEHQFLRDILEHYSQRGPTMDMEDFVAEMAVQMRNTTMGPLSALSARRRAANPEQVFRSCTWSDIPVCLSIPVCASGFDFGLAVLLSVWFILVLAFPGLGLGQI